MAAGLELGNRLFDTEDIMDEAEAGALAKGCHLATGGEDQQAIPLFGCERTQLVHRRLELSDQLSRPLLLAEDLAQQQGDRKSTRLNSSHVRISYAVFC